MKRFILPKNAKSRLVGGHVFGQDGTMIVSDDDAKRLERTLCRFHGVTMEDVEEEPISESEEGSLTVHSTAGKS